MLYTMLLPLDNTLKLDLTFGCLHLQCPLLGDYLTQVHYEQETGTDGVFFTCNSWKEL